MYDLVVIGGGTGGLVSAQIAAGLGARVLLAEQARTGGDCLWTGCVPSKALLAAAARAQDMRRAADVGLTAVEPEVDLGVVMAWVRAAQATIAPVDSPERLRAAGVEVVHGHACFTGPVQIDIDGRPVRFRRAIVATGSGPRAAPGARTTDDIWDVEQLPERLLVRGGGPTGCELAQAFARLGSAVTLAERADRLLPELDGDAGDVIARRLRAEGVDVRLAGVATPAGFDLVLDATGRMADTAGLGLEAAGIDAARDGIVADGRLRTTNRRVFAVGDVVAGAPRQTHVAAHHARVATPNALVGTRRRVERDAVPSVVYTDPEVATVGLSLRAARERWGAEAVVAQAGYDALDRAIVSAQTDGFARLVGDPKGRLVGATIVGAAAGESIAELTAWIATGAKLAAVSRTIHAYPTFAEGAARAADARALERLREMPGRGALRAGFAIARALARAR